MPPWNRGQHPGNSPSAEPRLSAGELAPQARHDLLFLSAADSITPQRKVRLPVFQGDVREVRRDFQRHAQRRREARQAVSAGAQATHQRKNQRKKTPALRGG